MTLPHFPVLLLLLTSLMQATPSIQGDLGTATDNDTGTAPDALPKVQLIPDALPADFDGTIPIANNFEDRNLDKIIFTWKLIKFPPAGGTAAPFTAAIGKVHLPDVKQQSKGVLQLDLPPVRKDADALGVMVNEFNGRLITSKTWPLKPRKDLLHEPPPATAIPPVEILSESPVRIRCGTQEFTFSETTGRLTGITVGDRACELTNGPRIVGGSDNESLQPTVSVRRSGTTAWITTRFANTPNTFRWIVHPDGKLQLDYRFARPPGAPATVGFDIPASKVASKRWVGPGPEFGWWKNTPADAEFHGRFPGVLWMTLDLGDSACTLIPTTLDTIIGLPGPSPATLTFGNLAPAQGDNTQLKGSIVFDFNPSSNGDPP